MEQHDKIDLTAAHGSVKQPFRQPLAVALVCLVFIFLLLFMGHMNLKAFSRSLVQHMEKNCLVVIGTVQKSTEDLLGHLGTESPRIFDPMTGTFNDEQAPSMEEAFINGLIDLARRLDLKTTSGSPNGDNSESYLAAEGLQQVTFLDAAGRARSQDRPLPEAIRKSVLPLIEGKKIFTSNIFSTTPRTEPIKYMAMRRSSEKGSIVLLMDEKGFQYRCIKFCLGTVLDDMARISEKTYDYLAAYDLNNSLIGKIGTPVDGEVWIPPVHKMFPEGQLDILKITTAEQTFLEITNPFFLHNQSVGTIKLGLRADDIMQNIHKNTRNIVLAIGFMVMITLISMWLLYKNQTRYVNNLQEMQARIHKAESLSALGRLAAGVAHEIRNPLNAISMAVQRIQKDNPHKLTKVIRDEIFRLNRIIEEFIGIAKSRTLVLAPYNIHAFLDQVLVLVREEAESIHIRIENQCPKTELRVLMDQDRMKQALLNIINNAMESISGPGDVMIALEKQEKNMVCITVKDSGVGLTQEQIQHIFDLDYTSKQKGLGLGLPLAHEIIKGHGGEIHVTSEPGTGTVFEILMPLYKNG